MPAPVRSLDDAFAQAMAALGPFEARPHLAAAVSGGADSLALALLAERWVAARGGRVTALTLDHGLRPESAGEARRVGAWLAARGIAHGVLDWPGAKPRSAIQARARAARYAILGAWCRDAGVLHLLLAHQMEDQAETLLLRLAGGSGPDGLAGMSALVERPEVRILRPLLGVSRRALESFLAGLGQEWIEDPSNRDSRFARTRVRASLPALAAQGVTAASLAAAARRFADVRVALEAATAALLARAARVHPAGFAVLSLSELRAAPAEIAARALARALAAVGGRTHPPALAKSARILAAAAARPEGRGNLAALAGCVVELRAGSGTAELLLRREGRGLPAPEPVASTIRRGWDGRFDLAVSSAPTPLILAPLGEEGWIEIVRAAPALRDCPIPRPVRAVLPALSDAQGVVRVPHLGYNRPGTEAWLMAAEAVFRPRRPLVSPGFFVASIA
ncbi:MAG: tRNA lysidine(34) synthetase TilS [Rhodospirillales bacterium RIFCSPLOWO2_12_FULL_67_15]|nr:MAG: tRNA lysidine(34) synthetase TilS [Rhodospirillales bacterium RIFCSPLOWO2_12_FULL_67_15]